MAKKQRPKKNLKTRSATTPGKKQGHLLPAFFYNIRLQCGLIMLFSFLLYGNTLRHDYTQDDALVIYDNMYTTQGLKGIPGILTYDTFKGFFKVEGKDKLVSGGRYRPFSLILFAIEWQLFKKVKKDSSGQIQRDIDGNVLYEGNTFLFHLVNILFYGLTGIVLYLLLLRMLQDADPTMAAFLAVATTFIFMAHPIHTEAVANIKGRDEILTLLGSLAAVYYSLRAHQEGRNLFNIAAAFIFFLALLSKENAITFVAIVPLIYYFFTKADTATIVRQSAPFLFAAIAFIALRFAVLGFDFGAPSAELMNNPFLKMENGKWAFLGFGEKMAIVFFTLGKYLLLLIYPHPLTHDYYPRQVDLMSWGDWEVLLSLLLYLGLLAYAIRGLWKKDLLSFGILFYLLTLSIVSNIVFPVGTNMSERFLFMPSIGFGFVVALLAYRFVVGTEKKALNLSSFYSVLGALALAIFLLSAKTIDRNKAWKDNFTLFTNDIQYSPNSAKLRNSVGAELSIRSQQEKDEAKKVAMLQEAMGHLQEALRIHPTYKNAFLQLGNTHNYLKQYDKAIEYYNQVLRLDPNDVNAINNTGVALRDARRFDESIQQFKKLYTLGGTQSEVDFKLAYVYEEAGKHYSGQGQQDRAIGYFQQAIPLSKDQDKLTYFMGVAFGLKKDFPRAIETLQKALSLTEKEENKTNIYRTLSNVYKEIGEEGKAAEYLRKSSQ